MIREINQFNEFCPFPAYSAREAWAGLPGETKSYFPEKARGLKEREWPQLPASLYLDFYRNGNRSRYENKYFERRGNLLTLTLAECIGGAGEFLDKIIDGVWLVSEESTWVLPAHLNKELPYPDDPAPVDLFAAETASLFSWIYYFLGDALAARSPAVRLRMEKEAERRILTPFLQSDFFWSGLADDRPVNNWNPWINSNLLVAYLVFSGIFPKYKEGVNKAIRSINRFIESYAEDGGCDEGPSYFSRAGASLFDFIEELGHITDVSYLYRQPKLQNMAAYIYKVYIAGNYYVNYADGAPEVSISPGLLNRVGKNTGDATLCGFTAGPGEEIPARDEAVSPQGGDIRYTSPLTRRKLELVMSRVFSLHRFLSDIFSPPPEGPQPAGTKAALNLPTVNWFPGIQVVTARDRGDSGEGLFFSAKGGHNDESHNHNDIGNFILYCDGVPVLIDAGAGTYTKFTFNEKRYTIWTMQSCYHNCPAVNGTDQLPGRDRKASGVSFLTENGITKFSMDIAGAYPEAAGIRSYRREFIFRQGGGLSVTDTWSLKENAPLTINLLCREKPEEVDRGILLSGKILLEYVPPLERAVDEIPLTDPKLYADWGQDKLYRLRLTLKRAGTSGTAELRLSKATQ
jgi:hypothetical protein